MSKRLSDTEVWKKAWFYDLDIKYKLFWFYILSDCDAAGIWAVNIKLAENIIRAKYEISDLLNKFKDQIIVLNGGSYWFVIDFIKFQYGYPLSDASLMRRKLTDLLRSRNLNIDTLYDNLNTVSIEYLPVVNTGKDKDKEEDKVKSEDELKFETVMKEIYPQILKLKYPISYKNHSKLIERFGKSGVAKIYGAMHNKADLTKKYTDAYQTALNWLKREYPSL